MLTQLIMVAVVLAFAATIGRSAPGSHSTVWRRCPRRCARSSAEVGAKVLLGAGVLGAALVAALVASLAGAWGISEVFGWTHTLNERPGRTTAKFYIVYGLAHLVGAVVVLFSLDLVNLVVDVEVMNALLLPIVLGLLLALEARALPFEHRMHGWRRGSRLGSASSLSALVSIRCS